MHTGHWMHRYYTETLHSMEERINAAIQGVEEPGAELTDIRQRYAAYLGWLEQPQVLCMRFEDLILDRRSSPGRLLDYLEQPRLHPSGLQRPEAVAVLAAGHRPQKIRHLPQRPARQLARALHPCQQSPVQRAGRRPAHPTWATSRTKPGDPGKSSTIVYPAAFSSKTCPPLAAADEPDPLATGGCSLRDVPVLFANSFPKSGTHLLTQVLQGFPRFSAPRLTAGCQPSSPSRAIPDARAAPARSSHDLQRLLPGDIAYGHLHALPEVVEFLSQAGMAAYFILRDPRDVVISHVHYVTEMEPDHIHHRYYTQELHSFDERLRTSILGISPILPSLSQISASASCPTWAGSTARKC